MATSWLLLLLICSIHQNVQRRCRWLVDRRPNLVGLDGELLDVLELEVDERNADGLRHPGKESM